MKKEDARLIGVHPLFCLYPHAGGYPKGGGYRCENGNGDVNDFLPKFVLVHGSLVFSLVGVCGELNQSVKSSPPSSSASLSALV